MFEGRRGEKEEDEGEEENEEEEEEKEEAAAAAAVMPSFNVRVRSELCVPLNIGK